MDELRPCVDCAAEGIEKLWPKRRLRQERCGKHYAKAKSAGKLPRKRRENGSPAPECTVDGCGKPMKANDLCASHNARRWRGAPVEGPMRGSTAAVCSFPGCGKPGFRKDLCAGHNAQKAKGKELTPLREYKSRVGTCEVSGCPREIANDGLCRGHYDKRAKAKDGEDWRTPIRPKARNGTGHVNEHGYRVIYVDGRKYLEHRYVMEQNEGRPLLPTETVHHMSGGFAGRSNNNLSNLELWTTRHPPGHRIEDVVRYCREMLSFYGDAEEQAKYAEHVGVVMADTGDPEAMAELDAADAGDDDEGEQLGA